MDIGESHLIMSYAAVIGIHSAYLTYVGVKYYKARSYAPAASAHRPVSDRRASFLKMRTFC